VSAQLDTRQLRLASSEPKITKPNTIPIDEFTPGMRLHWWRPRT